MNSYSRIKTKVHLRQRQLSSPQTKDVRVAATSPLTLKVRKSQGRFERGRGTEGKIHFYLEVDVTTTSEDIYVLQSVASGKKIAGFMYYIEGTGEGKVVAGDCIEKGKGVTMVHVGTLSYVKIPKGSTASFEFRIAVRGEVRRSYRLVFTRMNFKRRLEQQRYESYETTLYSKSVTMGDR